MTQELVTFAMLAVTCVLCVASSALGLSAVKDIAQEMRKLHLQQGNIIAMMIRAGFRPARGEPDWGDSGDKTRLAKTDVSTATTAPFQFRKPWN